MSTFFLVHYTQLEQISQSTKNVQEHPPIRNI